MAPDLFFSFIIPTYNRAGFIEKTIRGILEQSYPEFEIIVIDDGSTDNTKQVVNELSLQNGEKIKYIHQLNSERAASRNNGLNYAKGDYVIFFDSDDLIYPNYLSVACENILANDRPEFLHMRYDVKNKNLEIKREGPAFDHSPNEDLIKGNFLSCNGVILRKDIALKNKFNDDRALSALEDWELWLRLAVKYPIVYVNTITSSIVDHEERSVLVTDKDKLVKRINTLLKLVNSNKEITAYYKGKMKLFESSCFSYVALHLALTKKHRGAAIDYLFKSIMAHPSSIFTKRFLAILKHWL